LPAKPASTCDPHPATAAAGPREQLNDIALFYLINGSMSSRSGACAAILTLAASDHRCMLLWWLHHGGLIDSPAAAHVVQHACGLGRVRCTCSGHDGACASFSLRISFSFFPTCEGGGKGSETLEGGGYGGEGGGYGGEGGGYGGRGPRF
jgi:hypothetical protein